MAHVVINCRAKDIRRIKITCRCGKAFVAEFPQQIARGLNLHPCPGCGAGFMVSQQPDGKWKIERITETISGMTFEQLAPSQKRESYIGMRVKIVQAAGKAVLGGVAIGADPHPELIGKYGSIIGEIDIDGCGHITPQIKLDDGTMLTGAECWWEPVTM